VRYFTLRGRSFTAHAYKSLALNVCLHGGLSWNWRLTCGGIKRDSRLVMRGGNFASRDTLAPEGTGACGTVRWNYRTFTCGWVRWLAMRLKGCTQTFWKMLRRL